MYSAVRRGLIWLDKSIFIEAEQKWVKTARGRISSKAQNLKKKKRVLQHVLSTYLKEKCCRLDTALESQPVTFSQASGFKRRRLQMWRTMPQPEDRINGENRDCWLASVARDPVLGTSQHMDGRKVRPTKWGKSFDRWRTQMLSSALFRHQHLMWVTSPGICLKVSFKWHWQPTYFYNMKLFS